MPVRLAALCGLAAPAAFVGGLFLGDRAQPDGFSPADDDISDLGALTASSPWLYNQLAANLTGILVVGLAAGLWSALGTGLPARLGSAGLAVVGMGMALDGFLRLDCQGGVHPSCVNDSWHATGHRIESGITGAAVLLTPFVLALAFRRRPHWRSAWVPTLLAVPAVVVAGAVFASIGPGAASRAGSVTWFVWVGFVALRLWRVADPPGAPAPDTVRT